MIDFLRGTVTPKDWMAVAVILVCALLVGVVFAFFIHARQVQELSLVTTQAEQRLAELRKAQDTRANFDKLQQETLKIQQAVDVFEGRLPGEAEIATLLEQFEGMANAVGLDVELRTLPRSRDSRKETIPYGIVAKGTFHEIAGFVNRLERFERYLKISDLEISEEKEGVATAQFTLSTFRFLQPSKPGGQS